MPLTTKLDRTLRATEDDSDDQSYYEVSDRSSPSVVETGADGADIVDSEAEDGAGNGSVDESDDETVQRQISKVSFGALARAQDILAKQEPSSRKRKRGDPTTAPQDDQLQALRERLREIKAEKLAKEGKPGKHPAPAVKAKGTRPNDNDSVDSDEESSNPDAAPRARSSKHAPAVQSSKRAVTRRRKVVEVKKPVSRDPRFDNIGGALPDEHVLKKRYEFLNGYKDSEMAELRASIKKSKNDEDKEKLKRRLLSMESQKKTRDAKDKQQEIAREHRKKEREMIKEGKTPFYLKKSEQKKLALIDRFENMKSKQRDKVLERRRKKIASKEKKNMPAERRI